MTIQLEAKPRHDCRDRRRTNMQGAIDALNGCALDLATYAGNEGISFLVADRLTRLAAELEGFRARDLLNMRTAQ